MTTFVSPRIMSGFASTATSRHSASPTMPRTSLATSSSSSCRRSARTLAQGDEAAVVESVKAASEVYAPVSGEVTAINGELEGNPGLVNKEAQGGGWFAKIAMSEPKEFGGLMSEAEYRALLAESV